jgi:hypothetical protein
MLSHNPKLKRIELAHPDFASPSQVERLKSVVRHEMEKSGSTRGILRVLTEGPLSEDDFNVEAKFPAKGGEIVFFGANLPSRMPSQEKLHAETLYLAQVLCRTRRPVPENLEIVPLYVNPGTVAELEELYSRTYADYPVPLDAQSIHYQLLNSLAFGMLSRGKIVSALFGETHYYGGIPVVEFTLSATMPSKRGIGMTTALASRIRAEAIARNSDSIMIAETIAAPVMHSCHDLGMLVRGVLREHYSMTIGNKTFTNLYVWSL